MSKRRARNAPGPSDDYNLPIKTSELDVLHNAPPNLVIERYAFGFCVDDAIDPAHVDFNPEAGIRLYLEKLVL
ncbi:hypothetical protein WA026_019168, partial [Henosepilachna vigintioctopunctata]